MTNTTSPPLSDSDYDRDDRESEMMAEMFAAKRQRRRQQQQTPRLVWDRDKDISE
jgi:hypothetical protein